MIQRIQTVWWALSIVALTTFIFLPFVELYVDGNAATQSPLKFPLLLGLLILIALTTMTAIFLFKNRTLQIKIGRILVLLHFGIYSLLFYMYWYELNTQDKFLYSLLIPAISIVFHVLAIRAVKKDEALIKSMDRLR